MARNVEIKARVVNRERLIQAAAAIADTGPTVLQQDDTFFCCPAGRLKLRVFADQSAELIFYLRDDLNGPKISDYQITPVSDHQSMREILHRAYGIKTRVSKERILFLSGQTRIHIDRVKGLGDFMELEVVLADNQSEAEGAALAHALMQSLGIDASQLVCGAYADLLELRAPPR